MDRNTAGVTGIWFDEPGGGRCTGASGLRVSRVTVIDEELDDGGAMMFVSAIRVFMK